MITLGIETSCDETSVAVLENESRIIVNLVATQIEAHQIFGGVVPEIASRKHLEMLNPLLETARLDAGLEWRDIDLIAVTAAPGLVGSLLVGVSAAKALSFAHRIPCQPVNHLEGHIASVFLAQPELQFPMLCLVVSGGHSELVLMRGFNQFERLGRTRDDAIGEAYDKVARALNLPMPGGPNLEKLAATGDPHGFDFTVTHLADGFDFSYSGLKTAASQAKMKQPDKTADIAASFQRAAVSQLCGQVQKAIEKYKPATLGLCGGVAANSAVRAQMESAAKDAGISFVVPSKVLCTDNAAMIAAAGYFRFRDLPAERQKFDLSVLNFETKSLLPIGEVVS
jgi:N6-L-threonylcarbamoyladenine synthase